MRHLFKLALLCGLVPLVTGITIYVAWATTSSDDIDRLSALESAGLYTIQFGLILFAVGSIGLVIWFIAQMMTKGVERRKLYYRAARASALLFANFPVAALIVFLTLPPPGFKVSVDNESDFEIRDVAVFGRGFSTSFGAIGPGESRTQQIVFPEEAFGENEVRFGLSLKGKRHSGFVNGYVEVHANVRGRYRVLVDEDGTVTCSELQGRL